MEHDTKICKDVVLYKKIPKTAHELCSELMSKKSVTRSKQKLRPRPEKTNKKSVKKVSKKISIINININNIKKVKKQRSLKKHRQRPIINSDNELKKNVEDTTSQLIQNINKIKDNLKNIYCAQPCPTETQIKIKRRRKRSKKTKHEIIPLERIERSEEIQISEPEPELEARPEEERPEEARPQIKEIARPQIKVRPQIEEIDDEEKETEKIKIDVPPAAQNLNIPSRFGGTTEIVVSKSLLETKLKNIKDIIDLLMPYLKDSAYSKELCELRDLLNNYCPNGRGGLSGLGLNGLGFQQQQQQGNNSTFAEALLAYNLNNKNNSGADDWSKVAQELIKKFDELIKKIKDDDDDNGNNTNVASLPSGLTSSSSSSSSGTDSNIEERLRNIINMVNP